MLTLRQLSNGNTEKDSKALLISYKNVLQNILLVAPSASLGFQSVSGLIFQVIWLRGLQFNS